MNKLRALLFDHDGLIVDTEQPAFQSWQETFAEYGLEFTLEEWSICIGSSPDAFDVTQHLIDRCGLPLDREQVWKRRIARKHVLVLQQHLLPGVQELLEQCREFGVKTAIVSSSSRRTITESVERLGLTGFFDVYACGDEVRRAKPDPELYNLVLQRLNVESTQAIALEDSPNGVAAALGASVYCVAVPNEITRALQFPEVVRVPSLDQVSLHHLERYLRQT